MTSTSRSACAVAEAIGWDTGRHGKGLCVLLKGMQTPSRASVALERVDDGYVLRCATTEMGQGARHALSLIAAKLLGVEPGQVSFPDPDTDLVPYDTRTTSSRSTHMMGRALEAAVADLATNGGTRGLGEIVNEVSMSGPSLRRLIISPCQLLRLVMVLHRAA